MSRTPATLKIRFKESNSSPAPLLAALVLVALVPAVGVLWFMSVAMRNEHLAVQERLTAVYANHLASLQPRVTAWVKERQTALQTLKGGTAAETFAAVVRAGLADGVAVHDDTGKLLYPTTTRVEPVPTANTTMARTLLAQAAELLAAGQKEPALAKLAELAGNGELRQVTGAQGMLLVPAAQLLMLKLLAADVSSSGNAVLQPASNAAGTRAEAPPYAQTLADLVTRLNDYADSDFPSSQRRFLMREVKTLVTEAVTFPTLEAEELTADYLEREPPPPTDTKLERTPLAKVWRLPSVDRTVVALFREDRLRAELAAAVSTPALTEANLKVYAPSEAAALDKRAPSIEASELLPGWRLALSFNGSDPLALASARQSRYYLWSGLLVVLIIAVVAWLVARYVAAQMRLARQKDELVSTVSHELKTPLASMRALLDTALAGRYRDPAQLQRYLQLAAKENLRLSHLIENFLVFSRLSRGQQHFRFTLVAPQEIVRTALDAVGEKLTTPPCAFTARLAPNLPAVRGDADALSTVLVNLLDNAYKYSNGEKRIAVKVWATTGDESLAQSPELHGRKEAQKNAKSAALLFAHSCAFLRQEVSSSSERKSHEGNAVVFEVADNGIGIAPEEQARIFDRFYQVDQSLTRQRGGCGLGLSIVHSIVRAHDGTVDVTSAPGQGSTFRVRIPIAGEKP